MVVFAGAEQGVLEGIETWLDMKGQEKAKATISGKQYNVFGKTVSFLKQIAKGSGVSFTHKQDQFRPGEEVLTTIQSTGSKQETAASTGTRTVIAGAALDNKMASVLFSYAKDLVASNIIPTAPATPTTVVSLVRTVAQELLREYKKFVSYVEDAPTENPQS